MAKLEQPAAGVLPASQWRIGPGTFPWQLPPAVSLQLEAFPHPWQQPVTGHGKLPLASILDAIGGLFSRPDAQGSPQANGDQAASTSTRSKLPWGQRLRQEAAFSISNGKALAGLGPDAGDGRPGRLNANTRARGGLGTQVGLGSSGREDTGSSDLDRVVSPVSLGVASGDGQGDAVALDAVRVSVATPTDAAAVNPVPIIHVSPDAVAEAGDAAGGGNARLPAVRTAAAVSAAPATQTAAAKASRGHAAAADSAATALAAGASAAHDTSKRKVSGARKQAGQGSNPNAAGADGPLLTFGQAAAGRTKRKEAGGSGSKGQAGRGNVLKTAGAAGAAGVAASAGQAAAAEEEEEEEDSSDTTEQPFDVLRNIDRRAFRLFCSGCHKTTHRHDTTAAECNGCHRWFHAKCHQTSFSSHTPPSAEQAAGTSQEPWYHTPQCRQVLQALVQRSAKGLQELPPPPPRATTRRTPAASATTPPEGQQKDGQGQAQGEGERPSWRLIYCQRPGVMAQAALGQVHSVLSSDWAYTMQDIRSFDFAALLKLPGTPVCAALLDVYGPDIAELFVVSTAPRLRGRGFARELVLGGLAPALAEAGVRRLAVSVDEGDEASATLWGGYGFTPLKTTELRQLAWQLPSFSRDATDGTVYYSLDLGKRGL